MKNHLTSTVQQSVSDEGLLAIQSILTLRSQFCLAIEELERTLGISIPLDADSWLQAVIDCDFPNWPDGGTVDQRTATEFVVKLTGWRPLDHRSSEDLESACAMLLGEPE